MICLIRILASPFHRDPCYVSPRFVFRLTAIRLPSPAHLWQGLIDVDVEFADAEKEENKLPLLNGYKKQKRTLNLVSKPQK